VRLARQTPFRHAADQVHSHDETAQLLQALSRMKVSLAGIVGQVRASSDGIATGSAQVATGNANMNAALVEESAAAAERLKMQAARLAEVVHVFRLAEGVSTV